MTTIKKHLSEPWFSLVSVGKKTIEGRLNKGDFQKLKVGDHITFYNSDLGFFEREVTVEIIKIYNYNSFETLLIKKGLSKVLPTVTSIENGVKVYRNYYSVEDEKKYGILAIRMKKIEKK